MATINNLLNILFVSYGGLQIDELHHHNQNLVGTLHKGVPTVVYQTAIPFTLNKLPILLQYRHIYILLRKYSDFYLTIKLPNLL